LAKDNFGEALRRLLAHEGGYTNHSADPGGPTNFGITLADYRRHVKPGATAADIRAMKVGEAQAIYRAQYWDALRCDELPGGLDYALFDYGVNSGTARAARVLQRMLGTPASGILGDADIAAAARHAADELIARICEERLAFLRSLRTWPVFGKGWTRRVGEVRAAALAMAQAQGAPAQAAPASPSVNLAAVWSRLFALFRISR
jgi:lysozyme family protein